jgi:hypothetical protein
MSASNNTLPVAAAVQMFVPTPGKCAQLHSLWQATAAQLGVSILARKDAVALGESRGFNPATARTQFQVWFKRHSAAASAASTTPPAGTEEYAAPLVQSPSDAPVAPAPSESPADPAVADEPKLTRAQRKALAAAKHAEPATV